MADTATEVVRIKTQMENLNGHIDELQKTVNDNHAESKAELKALGTELKTDIQGIRTDSMTRHEAYTSSINNVKETFATKVELHEVRNDFEKALTDALAPIRRLGWMILAGMVTIFTGLIVTIIGGLILYFVTRG